MGAADCVYALGVCDEASMLYVLQTMFMHYMCVSDKARMLWGL